MPVVAGSEPMVLVMKSPPWLWKTGIASTTICVSRTNRTSIVAPAAISSSMSSTSPDTSRSRLVSEGADNVRGSGTGGVGGDQRHDEFLPR